MGVHKIWCSVYECDVAQALVCVHVWGVIYNIIGGGMLVNNIHIVLCILCMLCRGFSNGKW